MSHRNKGRTRSMRRLLAFAVLLLVVPAHSAPAQPPGSAEYAGHEHSPLVAFQKFISRADGPRCPMIPTCSQYSSQTFRRHNIFVGWMLTCDRLLRCGRDETRLSPTVQTPDGPRTLDSLTANSFWWKVQE